MSRNAVFWLALPLVVMLAAGLGLLRYRQDVGEAREAASRGGRMADTAAGPIEYAVRGAGAPLLSIHGAGGGYDQGLANAADLVGGGFHVIAPSRFGYLRTPVPPDASPAAQAYAHAALLSELKIPKAVVVGVSAGARSALELALRHPHAVSALILIVPGTYAPTSPVAVEASRGNQFVFWAVNAGADLAWWAGEKLAPSVLIRFIGVPPQLVAAAPEAERQRVMSIVRSIQPLSLRFPGINIDSSPDLRELPLEKIAAPTLIVSARDDLFNTLPAAEYAAARIPVAELVVYDTGGHLLVGHEQDVRDAVRAFLARRGLASTPNRTAAPPG
jgi:pimeloyl-ACP methyl ester carboxylesterase